jgi:hypothetical protein
MHTQRRLHLGWGMGSNSKHGIKSIHDDNNSIIRDSRIITGRDKGSNNNTRASKVIPNKVSNSSHSSNIIKGSRDITSKANGDEIRPYL